MFERTLQDLIRGLRAQKGSSKAQEDAFLAEAMGEIKEELRGKDMALKAEGIVKMCYLMMLYPLPPPPGFAFHVVEVMSSPRYHLKQLGYMAAPLAFTGETEEVVLTVNGIKKDLMSPHLPLPPLPLNALPHLLSLSPSLSTTLHPDLLHLLTHSSPRIRKRAVLCLLPCWEAFPEGLREGFPRLRDKLQDEDQGVVGATVSVVMELARRQGGKNYLPLAPELFGILTGSSNNWMLIKVVKLFAILTPLEPRLVRKLLPPITNLISSTSAISLLYECVRTCIVGGMLDPDRAEADALARVCVEKLGGYLRDEGGDQNLRYIALLAMVKIIPTHPAMVAEYQDEIMQSLDDPDVSIRMRALELVTSMVDQQNLQPIADQLLSHLAPPKSTLPSAMSALRAASSESSEPVVAPLTASPAYRLLLTHRLLSVIAHDTYANVLDFQWVVSVLLDIATISGVNVGEEVREMIMDVIARVKSVREYAVHMLERVVGNAEIREKAREKGSGLEGVLGAAVWICGEYARYLSSPLSTISDLLSPSLSQADPSLIAESLLATGKVFAHHCSEVAASYYADTHEQTKALVSSVRKGFEPFTRHASMEVQERAVELSQLLAFVEADLDNFAPQSSNAASSSIPEVNGGFESSATDGEPSYPKSLFLFPPLFTGYELNAVAVQAQASVRIPEGLDLDKEIVPGGGFAKDDWAEVDTADEDDDKAIGLGEGGGAGMEKLRRVLREQEQGSKKKKGKGKKKDGELTAEEKEAKAKRKAERRARMQDNPYYLGEKDEEPDIDDIPIVRLDDSELGASNDAPAQGRSSKVKQAKTTKTPPAPPVFDRTGELPDGAVPSVAPAITKRKSAKAASSLANVDLLSPSTSTREASRNSSTSRFDEYTVDDEDRARSPPSGTPSGPTGDVDARTPDAPAPEDVAAVAAAEVEVVRVKRKKKKKPVE